MNHAYDVLSDPDKKRKLYDEFGEEGLREGFDPEKVRAYRNWSSRQGRRGWRRRDARRLPGRRPADRPRGAAPQRRAAGGGFGDLFGDFGRTRGRRRGPVKGPDLESETTIDFASAVRGATLELRPQGTGGEPVTVRIPAGADEGSRVRIAGHGAPSTSGGIRGDLVLTIHVTPHPQFRREGDHLHLDLPVTIAEAFHGAKVKVPTVDGSVSMKVPSTRRAGSIVRLRGKGVARKGARRGTCTSTSWCRSRKRAAPEVGELVDRLAAFQDGGRTHRHQAVNGSCRLVGDETRVVDRGSHCRVRRGKRPG